MLNFIKNIRQNFFLNNKAFSLVELLVAVGVFAILSSGVLYVVTSSYTNFYGVGDKQSIVEFAQEGLEAVKSIRENSWKYIALNLDTDLGLVQTNGVWSFSGSSNVRGDLTRVINLTDVNRDSNGNIVTSGGTSDPLTKKVIVTVSGTGIDDYVLTSYLTSWSSISWSQTDWSGGTGTQYWSYDDQVYSSSSIDGLASAGDLTLSYVPGATVLAWDDLTEDANVSPGASLTTYSTVVDEANAFWYLCGSLTSGYRFDLSSLLSLGTISLSSSAVPVTAACYSSYISPVYSHYYVGGASAIIRTIDTGPLALVKTYAPTTTLGNVYAIVVSSDGSRMYAATSSGYVFSLSIASDGTLTCSNCTVSKGKDVAQRFGTGAIRSLWLDETNDKLYFSGDDNTRTLTRIDVSNVSSLSEDYYYSSAYDINDIAYVGLNTGVVPSRNRFVAVTDYQASGNEFQIIDDVPGSSTFTVVTGADLSAQAGKTINATNVEYTGSNEAFVTSVDTDGAPYIHLYTITGVDTVASPSVAIDLTNDTYYGNSSITYSTVTYSTDFQGIFAGWTLSASSARRGTYLAQTEMVSSGTYASSGNLVSSIFDLGSTDKELEVINIVQDVPSGCSLEVTLQTDDNVAFSTPSEQVISSTTETDFNTEIDAALSGQRWLRYQVDLTSCNSDADAPTLYSLNISYR